MTNNFKSSFADPPSGEALRDAYRDVLAVLRERLRAGLWVQGERLQIAVLARAFQVSPTPVREALARLAGEGLIEERRRLGYFAWRLDAVDLAELYDLQAVYLASAFERCGERPAAPDGEPAGPLEDLFERTIRNGRSLVLLRLQRLLADRLAPAWRAEDLVFGDIQAERSDLASELALGGARAVQRVRVYHARRCAAAPDIVAAMRSRAEALGV